MPKPADLEAQLAQQLRTVQAQAAALVGAVSKGELHILVAICCSVMCASLIGAFNATELISRKARSRTSCLEGITPWAYPGQPASSLLLDCRGPRTNSRAADAAATTDAVLEANRRTAEGAAGSNSNCQGRKGKYAEERSGLL